MYAYTGISVSYTAVHNSSGGSPVPPPPNGIQLFCFRMHFIEKRPIGHRHSPNGVAPPREILCPPLNSVQFTCESVVS